MIARKFYDISSSTPDLSTHMEDLGWQYPAEPIERAAVRFCEAIAKWRGKPELVTVRMVSCIDNLASSFSSSLQSKRNLPMPSQMNNSSTMTIESLVHSNPTSPSNAPVQLSNKPPRPAIEKYFSQPPHAGNKRPRSPEESRLGGTIKRFH